MTFSRSLCRETGTAPSRSSRWAILAQGDDGGHGMTTSRERGQAARTSPGSASPISPNSIDRKRRHCSPSAWMMRCPSTGWLPAASITRMAKRGISRQSGASWRRTPFKGPVAVSRGLAGKVRWRQEDAGGTPALPGVAGRGGGYFCCSADSRWVKPSNSPSSRAIPSR